MLEHKNINKNKHEHEYYEETILGPYNDMKNEFVKSISGAKNINIKCYYFYI